MNKYDLELIDKNLDKVKKLLNSHKLFSQEQSVKAIRNIVEQLTNLFKNVETIVMKYYPQDKTFVDILSALTYLLDERVEEIHNLAIKCDMLENQIELFKNKEE